MVSSIREHLFRTLYWGTLFWGTLFWGTVVALLLSTLKTSFYYYDEGLAVGNASRLMAGDIPYRDFWMLYPPGQTLMLAGLFTLAGKGLLVERLYDTAVRLAILLISFSLLKRFASKALRCVAILGQAVIFTSLGFYGYAFHSALLLALLSLLLLSRYFDTSRFFWLKSTGTALSLCMFFRWDVGVYGTVAVTGALLLEERKSLKVTLCHMLVPQLLGVLLLYGITASITGVKPLWDQVIAAPLTLQPAARWLPSPLSLFIHPTANLSFSLHDHLAFWIPILVLCVVSVTLVKSRQKVEAAAFKIALSLLLFAGGLLGQALSRFDISHCMPVLLVSPILLGMIHGTGIRSALSKEMRTFCLCLFLGSTWTLCSGPLFARLAESSPFQCHSYIPAAQCVRLDGDQQDAVKYLRANTQEFDSVYVGDARHDKAFAPDVGFYFLADRRAGTFHSELFPGGTTTLEGQRRIISDIIEHRVMWAVTFSGIEADELNLSSVSSKVHELDNFLEEFFSEVARFGRYVIRRRKVA